MKKPVCIGILGAANIVQRAVIEPAKKLEGVQVFGVAARDSAKAEKFAQDYDIPVVFPSYDALIESDRIDAVYIPLTNHLHTPWVIKSIQAKKPVLVEKPICLSIAEFDAIEAAVATHDVPVLEAVMVLHHPWQKKLREIVETGIYGNLKSIRTSLAFPFSEVDNPGNYRFSPEQGGGAFWDFGTYWIQLVQICLGLQPNAIAAEAVFNKPDGVDLTFKASLIFPQGSTSEFDCSFERPFEANHWLELETAHIKIRNFFRPLLGIQSMSLDVHHLDTGETEIIKFPVQNYYVNQLEFFLRVLEGSEKNLPLNQSRERVKIIQEIYHSAQRRFNN
ncbi:MAG: Gfo/Idh/MocA family oxidoreductase [Nostoc sp.]|uniref:Gfo/Idh/MocA family protein n=1 Tax=Nostoc sp. TaxID=1180 RepID=UPI002FF00894